MKAKDTVMEVQDLKNIVLIQAMAKHNRGFLKHYDMDDGVESGKEIAKAQAEVSFKAGYDEGFDKGCVFNYHEAKQAGMREVVEWIDDNIQVIDDVWTDESPGWQAQKKEWEYEGT